MSNKIAFFTISDPNYVGMVPVLFDSVRQHYPDASLYLFMIGKGEDRVLDDDVHVIYIEEVINARDLEQRLCFYLDVELATSFRPHCFQRLFDLGYEKAIYLDPDIYVFRRMTEVDELLDSGINGIVTPHALKSITSSNAAIAGGDRVFLQVGIFNLGFIALRKSAESLKMLRWWRDKLKWQCVADSKNGLFVDQKWMELLPIYFENFHILRLPTYNLAPWNAEHYSVFAHEQNFYIDTTDNMVAFIHFSGVQRSKAHFRDMIDAYEFYLDKLKKVEGRQYNFKKYELRWNDGSIIWDKVCTFLYKEWVEGTGDRWSSPLEDEAIFEHLTGTDKELDTPRYLRKAFEIYPGFASVILMDDGRLSFERLIAELKNKKSPYNGVAYPDTVKKVQAFFSPISADEENRSDADDSSEHDGAESIPNAPLQVKRSIRSVLRKFAPARSVYFTLRRAKRLVRVFRRLRDAEISLHASRERLADVETKLLIANEKLLLTEEDKIQQQKFVKLLLRQTRNADYAK